MREYSGNNEEKWVSFIKIFEEQGGKDVRDIDDHIKPTVFGFNALGFPTHGSCEGHLDHGPGAPYITFGHPPEPRFNKERETFQRIADKYGLPVEEVERGLHYQATGEALREAEKNGETPKYVKWREETLKMLAPLQELLEEFYRKETASPGVRLAILLEDDGGLSVHSEEAEIGLKPGTKKPSELTEEEKRERRLNLRKYRAEMEKLGTFLKNKFLGSKKK